MTRHFKAVHARHHHVGNNDVGPVAAEQFKAVDPVAGRGDVKTLVGKGFGYDGGECVLVLDKQNPVFHLLYSS